MLNTSVEPLVPLDAAAGQEAQHRGRRRQRGGDRQGRRSSRRGRRRRLGQEEALCAAAVVLPGDVAGNGQRPLPAS